MNSEASLKPVIDKLENLFSKFNEKFYGNKLQVPVITVSPDTTKGAYGWCTSWKAWSNVEEPTKDDGFYEINICAEYLSRPFEQTAATLLHEMVHLYNLQIGVQDTSRSGTYHNTKFKKAAEQHGLEVEKDAKYGWTKTKLNAEAKAFIADMSEVSFELHRKSITKGSGGSGASGNTKSCFLLRKVFITAVVTKIQA